MAVANTLATQITRLDAGKFLSLKEGGAVMRWHRSTLEVAAADDDLSVYRFMRVHDRMILRHAWLKNDAISGGSDYNLGFYETAANGGAVIDDNTYADAVSMTSARTALPIDAINEKRGISTVNGLGVTLPNGDGDLCWTGITVGTGAGTITMEVEYTELS